MTTADLIASAQVQKKVDSPQSNTEYIHPQVTHPERKATYIFAEKRNQIVCSTHYSRTDCS